MDQGLRHRGVLVGNSILVTSLGVMGRHKGLK